MRYSQFILPLLMLGVVGCSSSRVVQIRETPTGTLFDGKKSPIEITGTSIQLKDGAILGVDDIRIEGDSVWWSDSGSVHFVHIDSLSQINYINRVYGGLEGVGFGLLFGSAVGAVVGGLGHSDDIDEGASSQFTGAAIGGAAGSFVGLVGGVILGHRQSVTFVRVK
jgi:hypothetical protein